MLRILIGAAIVVALVGYGVLTPETLQDAGDRMKQGINNGASWIKEKTDPDMLDQIKDKIDN
jgi:xanthosine utilization system XapX-like protein